LMNSMHMTARASIGSGPPDTEPALASIGADGTAP
jgi:hypothetical protein